VLPPLSACLALLAVAAPPAHRAEPPRSEAPREPARSPERGVLLDEVVAVVRPPSGPSRVVTLSRLAEEARVALVSRGATGAAEGPLDAEALRAALEWVIDQMLLFEEAVRLQVFEPGRAESLAELERFQRRFESPAAYRAFLERLDASEEELLATLRRTLRVQRYLDSRVSLAARVREPEIDAWLRENAAQLGAADAEAARAAVRARLGQEKVEAEVRALLSDLRARSEIHVLDDLRGGSGG
jgi:hypothetical protein